MSHPLYELLEKLDNAKFYYTLSRNRHDAVLVSIVLVGERIEVDVFDYGHMEVSRYLGTEDVLGGTELIYDIINKRIFENKAWEKYPDKQKP